MMLFKHALDTGPKRLATLSPQAGVCDAAAILTNAETPLIVVCDGDGIAVGSTRPGVRSGNPFWAR